MKSFGRLGVIFVCMVLLVSYGFTEAEDSRYWPVEIDEKCGYEDKVFNLVIKPQFGICDFFYEGLARVKIRDKWGFINEAGKIVISAKFDEVMFRFYEGLASVKVGGKWGYIDKTGKYAIEPKFDGASFFSEGLASIRVGNKWGFINKKGDIVIDPKFDTDFFIFAFYSGKAKVTIGNRREYIDVSGEIISDDWEYCSQGKDGAHFIYYNKTNMSYPSKNIVRVWTKYVDLAQGHSMSWTEVDCLNRTSKLLESTNYNKEGKVINTYSYGRIASN
jgi:hypothetical protein